VLILGRDDMMIISTMQRRLLAEDSCTAVAGIVQYSTILVLKEHTNVQVLLVGIMPSIFWLNYLLLSETHSVVGSSVIAL